MFFKPNPTSGVPIYLQLMEQIRHAIETGAIRRDDQLPAIRKVAEDLVINPNTVAKVYKELEHAGIIELRQGSGAFVTSGNETDQRTALVRRAQPVIQNFISKLEKMGLKSEEIRRLLEAELSKRHEITSKNTPK